MFQDDVFVFDNAVHMYDLSDDNLVAPTSAVDRAGQLQIGAQRRSEPFRPLTDYVGANAYARRWTVEDLGSLLFDDSPTDMAMAQAVVLYDVYKDGFAPVQAQYEFAHACPDRVMFCGGVHPMYPGTAGALGEMTRQVKEMGVRSFQFYSGHVGEQSSGGDGREPS